MTVNTTPEKVKNLLSTFLASAKQQSPQKGPTISCEKATTPVKGTCESHVISTPAKSRGGTSSLRSYGSFLERLDTFSSLSWFGKPAELSPLICARYGWANVDSDSLQCVGCKAHLCGKLPSTSDSQAYKIFKEKLKKDILAAHDKFCVLAANPCPESFCVVNCEDTTSLISGFTQRVSSLESVSACLPNIDYSTLHSHSYDEGQGAAYCKRLLLPDSDTSPAVVALSLTGWSCVPSTPDIVMCSRCRRHVGLWNFGRQPSHSAYGSENNSGNSDDHGDVESVSDQNSGGQEPVAKMPRIQVKSSFNPVEEHKYWCPWLLPTPQLSFSSSSSSSSSSSLSSSSPSAGRKRTREDEKESCLPAFMSALKTMAPGLLDNNTGLAQAMKISPVADGLKCFRRVMKAWSSPKSVSNGSSPSTLMTSACPSTPVSTKAS